MIFLICLKLVKYLQLSIHKSEDPLDQRFLVLMKGAPEIILRQCSTYLLEGIQVAIDKNFVRAYELAVARLGKLGERVFGLFTLHLCLHRVFYYWYLSFLNIYFSFSPPPHTPNQQSHCVLFFDVMSPTPSKEKVKTYC